MKHFKLNFAASTVIIALFFSITSQAGLLSNTTMAPEDYCYVTSVQSNLTCTGSATIISNTTICTLASNFVNRPLLSISTANRFPLIDVDLNCPGTTLFCCAEIRSMTTAICATPPQPRITIDGVLSYFRISAIHCME